MVKFQSKLQGLATLRQGESRVQVLVHVQRPENQEHLCPMAGGDICPSSSRESESVLPPPFGSVQTLHRLDGSHPHW